MADIVLGTFNVTHTLGRAAYQKWAAEQVAAGTNRLLAERVFHRGVSGFVFVAMATNTTLGDGATIGTALQVFKSEIAKDGNGLTNLADLMNTSLDGYSSPAVPSLSLSAAGALTGQGTMYVRTTYQTDQGETNSSPEADLAVTDDHELVVASPAAQTGATGWNVYIGSATGGEKKQNTDPIAIGTSYTVTAALNTTNAAAPTTNGTACTKLQAFDLVPQGDSPYVYAIAVMSN